MNRPPDDDPPRPGHEPSGWAAPGEDPPPAPPGPPPGYGPPPGPPPGYGPPPGSGPPPGYGPPPGWGQGPPPGYGPPPGSPPGPPPGWGPPPPGWGAPRPTGGSARTGPLPLHPMTVSDILDGAFKLMKSNARSILVIVAVVVVPLNLLIAVVQNTAMTQAGFFDEMTTTVDFDSDLVLSSVGGALGIVLQLLNWLVLPFLAGAVSIVVAGAYLGREVGPGEAASRVVRRGGALLGAFLVVKLLQFAGVLLLVALVVALALGGSEAAAAVVGVVLFFPAGALSLVVMGFTVLVAPAIVVEELGPIEGIRRSFGLVRKRFWPVLGISLLGGLIATVLGSVLSFVPSLAGGLMGEWGWIGIWVGTSLTSIVTVPIVSIVATLLYFDARIRKEGFDLQVIATELSGDRGIIS